MCSISLSMQAQRKGHVRVYQEGDHLQPKERDLTGNQLCWHFHLGLPSIQNCGKIKFYCFSYTICGNLLRRSEQTNTAYPHHSLSTSLLASSCFRLILNFLSPNDSSKYSGFLLVENIGQYLRSGCQICLILWEIHCLKAFSVNGVRANLLFQMKISSHMVTSS